MPTSTFPTIALPGLPRAAPLALTRSFGARQLVLRVPEGDCLELDATARDLLGAAAAGHAETELSAMVAARSGLALAAAADHVARILDPVRDRLDRLSSTGVADDRVAHGFVSPAWQPPEKYRAGTFPSLPDPRQWRLLVAATARLPQAADAWRGWQTDRPAPRGETFRRLHSLVAANLASLGGPSLVSESAERRIWFDNATGLQRLAPVLIALHDAGIRVAAIKGLAAAVLDYRDLALRPMNDFDLVVPFPERRRAIAILEAAGFQAHSPCLEAFAHRVHSGAYVKPGQLNIDLHWHALWCNCWPAADATFWADARKIELAGAPCEVPTPEFRLLMTCAHGLRHSEVPAHYWIADAAAVLTAHGHSLDWERVLAEARARRLTRMLHEACRYLVEAMGAPIPAETMAALRAAPTAALENLIFASFQQRRPGRGAASRALVSWLNQYRTAARGFRPREILDFLRYLRAVRGGGWMPVFLLRVAVHAVSKLWREWLRKSDPNSDRIHR